MFLRKHCIFYAFSRCLIIVIILFCVVFSWASWENPRLFFLCVPSISTTKPPLSLCSCIFKAHALWILAAPTWHQLSAFHWLCLYCVPHHHSCKDYPTPDHPVPLDATFWRWADVLWDARCPRAWSRNPNPGAAEIPIPAQIPFWAQHHSVPLLCFLKNDSQAWRKLVDTTLWHIKAFWEDVNIWSGAYLAHLFSRPRSRSSEQSCESKGNSFVRIRNSLNAFSSLELSSLPNWC